MSRRDREDFPSSIHHKGNNFDHHHQHHHHHDNNNDAPRTRRPFTLSDEIIDLPNICATSSNRNWDENINEGDLYGLLKGIEVTTVKLGNFAAIIYFPNIEELFKGMQALQAMSLRRFPDVILKVNLRDDTEVKYGLSKIIIRNISLRGVRPVHIENFITQTKPDASFASNLVPFSVTVFKGLKSCSAFAVFRQAGNAEEAARALDDHPIYANSPVADDNPRVIVEVVQPQPSPRVLNSMQNNQNNNSNNNTASAAFGGGQQQQQQQQYHQHHDRHQHHHRPEFQEEDRQRIPTTTTARTSSSSSSTAAKDSATATTNFSSPSELYQAEVEVKPLQPEIWKNDDEGNFARTLRTDLTKLFFNQKNLFQSILVTNKSLFLSFPNLEKALDAVQTLKEELLPSFPFMMLEPSLTQSTISFFNISSVKVGGFPKGMKTSQVEGYVKTKCAEGLLRGLTRQLVPRASGRAEESGDENFSSFLLFYRSTSTAEQCIIELDGSAVVEGVKLDARLDD